MDADQVIRIALTVLTPILTTAIGIVALVIGDWRERRTQAGQRKLALEDAKRQVAFAADWWNASKLVATSPDDQQRAAAQAQGWLDEASALVAKSEPPPVDEQPTITLRRLLLAYPMHRRSARILRAIYWVCLGIVLQNVGTALGSAFGRPDTLGIPNYFSGGFIYGDLVAVFVMMLLAMAFRFASLHVEKSEPTAHRRLTLRRALLLYRFRRPAAAFARIVFYAWAALTLLVALLIGVAVYEDPRLIPANLLALTAFVGWTVGVRYWVVSLDERGTDPVVAAEKPE